jgi:hypothetical protein
MGFSKQGFKQVVLCGERELLEICIIVAQEIDLNIRAVVVKNDVLKIETLLNVPVIEESALKDRDVEADLLIICEPFLGDRLEEAEAFKVTEVSIEYLF